MQPMYYVLIISLVVFFVAYLCYHIKKNKKKGQKAGGCQAFSDYGW